MPAIIKIVLFTTGVIHLLPLMGALGVGQLHSLYAVSIEGSDLEILMRHRAVLFGLLGAFLIYATFNSNLELIALIAALISVASFIFLAWTVGSYQPSIAKVVYIDIGLAIALVVALGMKLITRQVI